MPVNTLSILIPIYNEEQTLPSILKRIEKVDIGPITKELICIDDASTDRSFSQLQAFTSNDVTLKVLRHEKNQGKGAAVRTGLKAASGDVVLIQDADLEYDPEDYKKLLEPFVHQSADVVYGTRFWKSPVTRVPSFWHYIANKLLTMFSNALTNLNLTDVHTCYKMFRRDLLDGMNLKSERFGICVELTAKFAKLGVKLFEVPISYEGRTYRDGKKITWRDGIAALWHNIRFNLLNPL